MKPNLPLATFIKSLYPTYSKYMESLQTSDKFKDFTFDILVEKIATKRKPLERRPMSVLERPFSLLRKERTSPNTLQGINKKKRTRKKKFQR